MVFLNSPVNMFNQQHLSSHSIDSYFEPFLNRVLNKDKLAVGWSIIEVDSISSSCGKTKGDIFRLSIPYAGQNLIWNVLFDSQYPELGPDFIFGDETFLVDPNIESISTNVPSLAKWDYKNDNALLRVIIELLSYYKDHQVQLLKRQGQRLTLEYNMLMDDKEISPKDIEVILLPVGTKPTEACFSIRLDIDFSQLPTRTSQPQNDAVMLLVTFCGKDWNRVIPKLYLSKSLEEIFTGPASLHIPPFLPQNYLPAYIPQVKKLIMDKINTIIQCYESRKNFVSALLFMQRDSIIEYDAVKFNHITLLLEHRDFYFLVHFYLQATFPKDKPVITLQSVYHMTEQGNLYTQMIENYSYDPKYNSQTMISKILMHIIENEVPKFKENSTKNNRFCKK